MVAGLKTSRELKVILEEALNKFPILFGGRLREKIKPVTIELITAAYTHNELLQDNNQANAWVPYM